MRVPKTVAQKLSDLEDHLFLLACALGGLDSGQGAHLRNMAADLRVLICSSSGTEGLMWRLIDELHVNDDVQLHQVGNVDPSLPFAQGLRCMFLPLRSPGRGDPRLPIEGYSLRGIIKGHEAIFVAGQGLTHEKLIKFLSQQIGSAHEDDAISLVLAELNAILIANVQPFFHILHSDAFLTIDVGERVLQKAAADLGYQRRHASFLVRPGPVLLRDGVAVTVPMVAPTVDPIADDEGTISFLLNHPDARWKEPGVGGAFQSVKIGRLTFNAVKTPDCLIELRTTGLFLPDFTRRWPLPKIGGEGLRITVTWKSPEIRVYLNGALAETILSPEPP